MTTPRSTLALFQLFERNGEVSDLVLHDESMLNEDALLVHFTSLDAAHSILREGFTKGVPDVLDIGLTSSHQATGAGFNFAFVANDYPDRWSDGFSLDFVSNLVRDDDDRFAVVMFRAAAVHTYHWDDMCQAIFWGPEVVTDRLLVFEASDEVDGTMHLRAIDGGFEGSMKSALRHADIKIGRRHVEVVSQLPWGDLASLFNADNLRAGLNPYLPLRGSLDELNARVGIEAVLGASGTIAERLPATDGSSELRWEAAQLDGMEVALTVEYGRSGVSIALRPLGKGSDHPLAQVFDLPLDMNRSRLEDVLHRLAMRALPDEIVSRTGPR